jgi:hypothetical protein
MRLASLQVPLAGLCWFLTSLWTSLTSLLIRRGW